MLEPLFCRSRQRARGVRACAGAPDGRRAALAGLVLAHGSDQVVRACAGAPDGRRAALRPGAIPVVLEPLFCRSRQRTERSAPARARRTAGGPPCGLERFQSCWNRSFVARGSGPRGPRPRGRTGRPAGRLAAWSDSSRAGTALLSLAAADREVRARAGAPDGRRAALRPGAIPVELEPLFCRSRQRTERSAPARARRTAGGPPCGLERFQSRWKRSSGRIRDPARDRRI